VAQDSGSLQAAKQVALNANWLTPQASTPARHAAIPAKMIMLNKMVFRVFTVTFPPLFQRQASYIHRCFDGVPPIGKILSVLTGARVGTDRYWRNTDIGATRVE
jgi:hypothetical protein